MILKDITFTGSEVKQQNRAMFHRIWEIFSSYNSPSTDHGRSKRVEPERTKVVKRSNYVKCNQYSACVYAGRGQTVNITNRPSSDITSMLTWLPGTSYEEPGLEYENARKRVKGSFSFSLNCEGCLKGGSSGTPRVHNNPRNNPSHLTPISVSNHMRSI